MRFVIHHGDDFNTLEKECFGERQTYKDKHGRYWVYAQILPVSNEFIASIKEGGMFFEYAGKVVEWERQHRKAFPHFGTDYADFQDAFDTIEQLHGYLDDVALPEFKFWGDSDSSTGLQD